MENPTKPKAKVKEKANKMFSIFCQYKRFEASSVCLLLSSGRKVREEKREEKN